jgi:hypothetical protein
MLGSTSCKRMVDRSTESEPRPGSDCLAESGARFDTQYSCRVTAAATAVLIQQASDIYGVCVAH